MSKKILIIGGTGVISYAVVQEALSQGFEVTCINRGKSKSQILPDQVVKIIADYRDSSLVKQKLIGLHFDAVIDVLCYTEQDIDYSVTLLKDYADQYVFFSSCAVYNKGKGDYECTENSPLVNPVWDYSINKVKCEKRLIELSIQYKFPYTIIRPAVTYGNTRIPYGIMPPYGYHGTLIQRILHDKPIIIWNGGVNISTITHVNDFACGLVGLLGNSEAYNQAFHIVGDERYQWKEVLETIGRILQKDVICFDITAEEYSNEIPERRGELIGGRGINQLLDNTKIKTVVPNFHSRITLIDGLKQTIDYYKDHGFIKGIDYRFDADTDRIIKKYSRQHDDVIHTLGFINYLGNATLKDRLIYWSTYYKESPIIRLFKYLKNNSKLN